MASKDSVGVEERKDLMLRSVCWQLPSMGPFAFLTFPELSLKIWRHYFCRTKKGNYLRLEGICLSKRYKKAVSPPPHPKLAWLAKGPPALLTLWLLPFQKWVFKSCLMIKLTSRDKNNVFHNLILFDGVSAQRMWGSGNYLYMLNCVGVQEAVTKALTYLL